jgi:hypothetical protein
MTDNNDKTGGGGFWDDEELERDAGGVYIKFEVPGDSVIGTITGLSKRKFIKDDNESISYDVKLDGGRTVTVSQWMLKNTFYALQPNKGDTIDVTFVDEVKKGSKTTKRFRGKIQYANGEVADFDHTVGK